MTAAPSPPLRGLAAGLCLAAGLAAAGVALARKPKAPPAPPPRAGPPHIVLIFPDNVGWGEIGAYGSVRGDLTPRIDRLAAEGLRLDNFNVEPSCTVSRAALMTGRYAIRTGATQNSGITLWEVTLAEALKDAGYATALFGKWHLGGDHPEGRREPGDQGFDEFYGIPRTSNEAQTTDAQGLIPPGTSFLWEGKAGEDAHPVGPFDLTSRPLVDRESALRGAAFLERSVAAGTPAFLYLPMTQLHFPTVPHPDFAGASGAGDLGDAVLGMDHDVGIVLDAIDRLGIRDDTLVFFCTDNGAEARRPWRGSPGPWSGFYNSAMEGGIRTPCIVRWPGHVPAGRHSDELVHEIDLFPTLAAAVGADLVPHDRPIDGVDQLAFLTGAQERSARDSVLVYGLKSYGRPWAAKWHDWKLHYAFQPEPGPPPAEPELRLFHLRADPREEFDVKDANPWVQGVVDQLFADFEASAVAFPHVPPDASDPYLPPGGR